ncbi:hybrid sensor histidine kinase/response regulator [Burkholderia sp. PAMC 28687]|uniref:histidine kinase n=1 Tax=Caballeronia sordidicola TaxID=196367 RepID=A0A242N238_CABSO|nr:MULTISPECIES: hybrid sensor histidine kinase/response regulator [Burkholderiaceae]AMM14771.1 hybrid sensor histidine kinase/response regulator [Burkholderia sp. PAMC 28687]OTP77737.1 Sensory box sensor histidine kinase/response regulator [Caballeronia sordidicola]
MESRVLILAPRGRDADVISEVLSRDVLKCLVCTDAATLNAELRAGAGTALIAEEALTDDDMPQLFQWLEQQPTWSDFPLILLATKRTERRPKHALELLEKLGNVVVLERPLHAETLRRAVASSLRARLRQYEARRQLVERVESQERLHLALAAGRLGSWELDVETGALRSTEAFRKIFGLKAPIVEYAQLAEAIHPEDREMRQRALERCIEENTNLTLEYRAIWPDGSIRWVESRGHPMRTVNNATGAVTTRIIGVSLDVTDRHAVNEKILASQFVVERLNDTLESRIAERTQELASVNDRLMKEIHERAKVQAVLVQAQKMEALGQLTGGIAHDFNNLLNVIMGNAELITRVSLDERVQKMAHTVKRATERGAKLTGQLLTFSRSSNLDLKAVDVISMLHGMRDMLTLSLGTGIHFGTRFNVEEAWTDADANQLELAVLNLGINARDAMPDGGLLTISVDQRAAPDGTLPAGQYVVIGVSDTGTGIAPELLTRVFDPFFTTKPVGKGTGLGLSQVYGIATQAGGTARIYSEEGKGTTVELWLPLRERQKTEVAVPEPYDERSNGHQRILVIEDDVDVRTFLVDCLKMLGYTVTEAAQGRLGLERLRDDNPDLLMVDFAMPGMNGLEVITEVKRTHPQLPVILATGYADVDVSKYRVDGYAVLRKPFKIGDLARTVKAALMAAPA